MKLDAYTTKTFAQEFLPEYQPSTLWVLDIPGYPEIYIKEANVPLYKLTLSKLPSEGLIPGERESFGNVSLTVYETTSFDSFTFFRDKLDRIYDYERKLWRRNFHSQKMDATLRFIKIDNPTVKTSGLNFDNATINNEGEPKLKLQLHNLLVIGMSDLALTYDSNEPLTFEVTCEVENIVRLK